MSLEQASAVLRRIKPGEKGPLTPEETRALFAIGAAILRGEIDEDKACELAGIPVLS